MKINQLKAGVILSYATQGVQIVTGILYTPVMLRLLGQSEYGLYQLVYSVVSYLSLLSLGFGASYVRFYSRYKVQNNENEIAKLNGMFMTIFAVISAICILCGIVMVHNAESIFGDGLTTAELAKSRILLGIMVFNMAFTFVDSVFTSIITAHERFLFQRLIKFLKELFNPFLTLPLLLLGYGSVAMVVITTILTFTGLACDCFFCLKKLKVKFVFSSFNFSLFKEMWGFTFYIFLGMIVDQMNWSVDKFLLGRMIGTAAVAVYGVAAQLNTLYIAISCAVSSVFIPKVNQIVVEGSNCETVLSRLFIKVGRIQFLILGLVITGYIVFGKQFIRLWAGDGYGEAYIIGLFLMIPVTIPLIQNLGVEIQRAKNMHKSRAIVYLLVAIGNIFISIPCIQALGVKGAAVGTAVSLIVGTVFFMNYYYHKKIHLNIIEFWKSLSKLIILAVIISIIGVLILKILPYKESVILLAMQMFFYCLVYFLLMWKFGMNKHEKELISTPIKNVLKKVVR